MGNIAYSNNASATLAAGITASDVSLTLSAGQGARFPSLATGQYSLITLEDVNGVIEIVKMTSRAGDVMTVERAQEGTTAAAFASGSRVELRITKASLDNWLQKAGDTMPGQYNATGGKLSGGTLENFVVINPFIRGAVGETANELRVAPGDVPKIGGNVIYHAGNLTQLKINQLAFPVGTILMFNGAIGNIPAGFQLCDGTNGTLDLRDKFIVGAGSSYGLGTAGGSATATTSASGGHTPVIQPVTLTSVHLPAHHHRIWGTTSGGAGDTESFANTVAAIAGNADGTKGWVNANAGGQQLIEDAGGTGSGAPHTHAADFVPDHTHTVNALPPYCGVFFIQRV